MGPSSGISNPAVQANQHSNQPNHYYLTPPTGSPNLLPFSYTPPLPLPIMAGGTQFSFSFISLLMVSTCVSQIPSSPYLQQALPQHHLGKFHYFYLLV